MSTTTTKAMTVTTWTRTIIATTIMTTAMFSSLSEPLSQACPPPRRAASRERASIQNCAHTQRSSTQRANNRTNNNIADRAFIFSQVPSILEAATFRSPTLMKTRRIVDDDDDIHDSDDDDNDDNGDHDDDHGDVFLVVSTST